MKKPWRVAALSLTLIACLCLAAAVIFWNGPQKGNAGGRARMASEGLDEYSFDLVFRPEESTLAVAMTLRFTNRTGDTLREVVLRTWAGAYAREQTSPAASAELYSLCYPGGFSPGGIALSGVWWNGGYVQGAAFADAAQTVLTIPVDALADGESGLLALNAVIAIPDCSHRLGHAGGVWQFGNALPILSVYADGAWRTDAYHPVGDPFVSDCANYTVTLALPKGYQVAASGACTREDTKDGGRVVCRALAVRDFAFALSDQWAVRERRVNGVAVTSFARDGEAAGRAALYASQALKLYAGLYGEYPWDVFTVCEVDFPFGGMEYPGLVMAGQAYYAKDARATLELILAHEAAHQWFYALVGSDQYFDPWLDEAACEYAMLRYALDRYGKSAYDNLLITRVYEPMRERVPTGLTPGSPIDYFGNLDDYTAVVYGRGAAFLLAVEEWTGDCDAFLRDYCGRFAFARVSREDFEAALNAWSGEDLSPLLNDYIDTMM